jgi:hypothetical protein
MKEKVLQLLAVLNLPQTPENHDIVQAWFSKNSKLIQGIFPMDPNLFGQEKEKAWTYGLTKTCLEIGRLAVIEAGEIEETKASLQQKVHLYRPRILVWDLRKEIEEPKKLITN